MSESIIKNLTPDLLPKKYLKENYKNPMFGHCHTSSACLQKIFGSKSIKLYRALDDNNIWHWWAQDNNGKIIDLTSAQYIIKKQKPPYENGQISLQLGFGYKKFRNTLYNRVIMDLNDEKEGLLNYYEI